jgi:hypothetical protein
MLSFCGLEFTEALAAVENTKVRAITNPVTLLKMFFVFIISIFFN